MPALSKNERGQKSSRLVAALDRALGATSRHYHHNVFVLALLMFCAVVAVGFWSVRDLQKANSDVRNIYVVSVRGLQQVGELQYDAQETRRATLYALTTDDSNLQVGYADQSRDADRQVTQGIAEYRQHASLPAELVLGEKLNRDWASYLKVRDEVLASILEGSTKEAVSLDLSAGAPSFERVRLDLDEVKRMYDEGASQRLANVVATSRRSEANLIGILCFAFVISSSAIWAIQRSRMLSAIQLARLQMEFVASVSHELRTPLAALSLAADNIADGLVEGKTAVQKYGTAIQKEARQMSELVGQILLFASTEDRTKRYDLQPLQVSEIIDSVLSGSKDLIQRAGFMIELHMVAHLPLVVGDPSAVAQCLQNLIGNALKYSGDSRWIGIRAFVAQSEIEVSREVRIAVSDRGIGIDGSELADIFEPFYRSSRVNALQIHGTGLGLSLAKRTMEAMGGKISVVSELSAGSTFTIHLPTTERNGLERARATPRPHSSTRA
jgi:signal transduction histidine kinase